MNRLSRGLRLWVVLLLTACATQPQPQLVYQSTPPPEPEPVEEPAAVGPDVFLKARLLADILYAAKVAYADNRLMSPSGDNAYDRYIEVLQLDPGNTVALEGIQEIALRYINLADTATGQGRYDDAASLLARSARLNPDLPELEPARERLRAARQNKIESYNLNPEGLREQSLETMVQLAEIAQHIMRNEATFLINARSDEEGRWIYRIMREAVGGYRLRGNIDISGIPHILVTVPAD
jgi:tetratricopeptide (TPR) repeat protein